MQYKLIKLNTREHRDIQRVFAHSTLNEKKVMMNVTNEINKLQPKDWENKDFYKIEIPMNELMERTEANYEAIKRTCKKIASIIIYAEIPYKIKNGKTEIFKSHVCVFPECGISENTFRIEVKTSILPLLSRALEEYRHYNIIEAKFLTHRHSVELYKFLKDKINKNNETEFLISVENLKIELGLEKRYELYANFKNRVLEPAQKDMKAHSFIYFEYKEIKKNRSVSDLYITIKTSEENEKNIYLLERIKNYIKTTTEEQFKKDFENFIMRSYYDEDDRNKHLEPLKTKKSLKEFPEKIQLKFINFLKPA